MLNREIRLLELDYAVQLELRARQALSRQAQATLHPTKTLCLDLLDPPNSQSGLGLTQVANFKPADSSLHQSLAVHFLFKPCPYPA